MAAEQVRVLPVKNDDPAINDYSGEVTETLKARNIRVKLDNRSEKLGYRMREGQIQKVPYLLVLGQNEKENNSISFRLHGQKNTTELPLESFADKIAELIHTKSWETI
ncbi:MAG: hypothetical protein LUF27_06170 [Lachnospiraceae bacterium]|nr:hypothetical protein [Lachnospiraceae bacterium]